MLQMEGEIKNLIKVWLSVVASLCYCYFIASKIPKGMLRLFSILPIFYLFTILPLSLSFMSNTFIFSGLITWFASFKLLLFAFDQGPLSCDSAKSLVPFILLACLPVTIKQNGKYPSPKPHRLPLINWPIKFLLLAILVRVHDYRDHVHPIIVTVHYSCLLYLSQDIAMRLCSVVVHAMFGIELESPFIEPHLSTSLQDFWGRRWNINATNLLRHTVYKPVRYSLGIVLGARYATYLGVFATFLVSGLMHELMVYYFTRASPTWEMTLSLSLNGVGVVGELVIKRLLKDRWQLHPAVSRPLTVGFVLMTAHWLFFPPVIRVGTIVKMFEECNRLVEFVLEMPKLAKAVSCMY